MCTRYLNKTNFSRFGGTVIGNVKIGRICLLCDLLAKESAHKMLETNKVALIKTHISNSSPLKYVNIYNE